MPEADERRRQHRSALGYAIGFTLLVAIVDFSMFSHESAGRQLAILGVTFALGYFFWRCVHALTRGRLISKDAEN